MALKLGAKLWDSLVSVAFQGVEGEAFLTRGTQGEGMRSSAVSLFRSFCSHCPPSSRPLRS